MTKRPDLPSPNAPNFDQRLRETLMTYLGRQGDPLDRGITLRDLVEAGVVKIKDGYVLRPGGETIPIEPDPDLGGGGGGTTPYEPDLTPPPTPTGFAVSAAISHIFIEHDPPAYAAGHGHLRTRVYGKVVQVGDPLPTFADAAEIAQFTGAVYAFPTNPATTWHLWIKWESVDGVLSVAPAGGTNGLVATTGQDVSDLLEALAGEITESQLFTDLATRIGLIDGEGPGSVNDRIAGATLTLTQAILEETDARTLADQTLGQVADLLHIASAEASAAIRALQTTVETEDEALAATSLVLRASLDTAAAGIAQERLVRATGDSALASETARLAAGVGANAAAIVVERQARADADSASASVSASLASSFAGNAAALQVEQTTRATADSALSAQTTTLSAAVGDARSALVVEQQARATADTATASQVTTLGASIGSATAGLIVEQSVRATADSAISQQVVTVAAGVGAASSAVQVEQTARATADAASSQQVVTLSAALAANAAAIQTEQTARANADSASASSITVLQAGVGDNTAAIALEASVRAEETGDLFAQYTVKTDLAGFVSGYGLASTAPAGADPTSQFIVRADRFVVAPPSYTGSTEPAADAWGANSIQHFVRGRALLAVGGAGRVALAPSASGTWIFQTALRDGTWGAFDVVDAAWNGQVYVAVGSAGRCAVSSDGAAWEYNTSLATALSSLTAFGIAWNGATFVVVGSNARVATSPDGKVWTARTGLSTVWGAVGTLDVLWDGAQFIAVGFSGRVATSPDGISWTNRSGLSSTGWSTTLIWRLMQHGSTVYALGADGKFAFSTDGAVTWTYTTNLRATTWGTANDIRGGAVAPAGTYLHDSGTVGAGATTTSIPLGKTVLLSTGSTYYLTMTLSGVSHRRQVSSTGSVSTLTVAEFPSAPAETTAWTLEVEGSPLILVVGENGACATSPNGTDWTYRATLAATSWATETGVSAVWDDGQFVIGSGAGKLATSPNGVTWTVQPAFGYASNLYGGFVWLDTSTTPPVTKYRSGDSWVTSPTALPLVVQSTPTVVDGQPIPAGVYMDAAFIRDATITRAKIANLAVDDAKIANLSVSKLTAGSIAVGEYIQSSGFVSGSAGFRIDGNGNAQFNNGTFRGTVYAAAGEIGGSVLGADFLRSTNFSAGSAGWRLKSDGTAEFGAAAIRGQLTADQINTNGLTIKDAEGTVVFSASVPLAGAYIANAAITTAKIGDAQITTGKIGDAQITTAKIGDLAVSTLKIADEAVTIPRYAHVATGSTNTYNQTWTGTGVVWSGGPNGASGSFIEVAYPGPSSGTQAVIVALTVDKPGTYLQIEVQGGGSYDDYASGIEIFWKDSSGTVLGTDEIYRVRYSTSPGGAFPTTLVSSISRRVTIPANTAVIGIRGFSYVYNGTLNSVNTLTSVPASLVVLGCKK